MNEAARCRPRMHGVSPSRREAVERAEAYLRAHFDAPVPVSRLSRLVGLSERGLRDAFYKAEGMGPKRWIVTVRLQGVHDALTEPRAEPTTVTQAATDHGFYELGRFAATYREAFGEPPSATLRSANQRPSQPLRYQHRHNHPSIKDTPMLAPARPVHGPFARPLDRSADTVPLQPTGAGEGDQRGAGSLGMFRPPRGADEVRADHCLRREVERLGPGIIVGRSIAIQRVLEQARQIAATDSTVLLLGETGTGKELIATQIHEQSSRRGRAMVRINCAAIPSTLIESELFGREKGAFTGALARQIGRFELADHSSIFLDEIGDLPFDVQVKLLRVLEERRIERLGSPRAVTVDVRIIAATHRNLEQRIAENGFRQDLYYRLNVFPIELPPLRERTEDIPLLVWRFVDEFSRSFGKRIDAISRENMEALQRYPWPGNIRELRNVVERAMIVAVGHNLTIAIPAQVPSSLRSSVKLIDVQREHVLSVVETCGWRIRGVDGAAERLGLRPTTLETRMVKLGIKRPSPIVTPARTPRLWATDIVRRLSVPAF